MKVSQLRYIILTNIIMRDKDAIGYDVRLSNDKHSSDYFMLRYEDYDKLVFTIDVIDEDLNFIITNHVESYDIKTGDFNVINVVSTPQPNEFRDVKRGLITSLLENVNNLSPEIDKYLATLN